MADLLAGVPIVGVQRDGLEMQARCIDRLDRAVVQVASEPGALLGHQPCAVKGLDLLAGLHLSERALLFITTNLGLLRAGEAGLAKLEEGLANLERTSPEIADGTDPGHSASATSLIQWFLAEGTNRPTGRRSSDQIVRRFRQKVLGADTPERLSQALDLLRALAGVLASPAVALQRGEEIAAQFNLEAAPLDRKSTRLNSSHVALSRMPSSA